MFFLFFVINCSHNLFLNFYFMHFQPILINCFTVIGNQEYDDKNASYLLKLQNIKNSTDHKKSAEYAAKVALSESGLLCYYETLEEALDPFWDIQIRVYTDLVSYFEFYARDILPQIFKEWEEKDQSWDYLNQEYYKSVI